MAMSLREMRRLLQPHFPNGVVTSIWITLSSSATIKDWAFWPLSTAVISFVQAAMIPWRSCYIFGIPPDPRKMKTPAMNRVGLLNDIVLETFRQDLYPRRFHHVPDDMSDAAATQSQVYHQKDQNTAVHITPLFDHFRGRYINACNAHERCMHSQSNIVRIPHSQPQDVPFPAIWSD